MLVTLKGSTEIWQSANFHKAKNSLSQNRSIEKEIQWEATMICHGIKAIVEPFIMEWIHGIPYLRDLKAA